VSFPVALAGSAVVIALGLIFVVVPAALVRRDDPRFDEGRFKARSDVRMAAIQIVGGTALLVGLVFTNRSLGLNQQGQITDRFTKATDQLGSDKPDIRLGGIYSMERIARDSKNDQGPVMEVLTAFGREHAPTSTASAGPGSTTVTTDVQAVLTVVGRRNTSNDPTNYILDLDHTDLNHANLVGAHLAGANLRGVFLRSADLRNADLRNADLIAAQLIAVNFKDGADLSGADLSRAHLSRADFSSANLSRANLTGADLSGGAILREGAVLANADLRGANLTGANLKSADLTGAIGLTQAQIDSALTDNATKLPAGLKPHG
jgi:uncharacterized protein YjbI with pentapeptide repeats